MEKFGVSHSCTLIGWPEGDIHSTSPWPSKKPVSENTEKRLRRLEITWVDWKALDDELIAHTAFVSGLRKRFSVFSESNFFTGNGDVAWLSPSGQPMTTGEWETPNLASFGMMLATRDGTARKIVRLAIVFNRSNDPLPFTLPAGSGWRELSRSGSKKVAAAVTLPARSAMFYLEN